MKNENAFRSFLISGFGAFGLINTLVATATAGPDALEIQQQLSVSSSI